MSDDNDKLTILAIGLVTVLVLLIGDELTRPPRHVTRRDWFRATVDDELYSDEAKLKRLTGHLWSR